MERNRKRIIGGALFLAALTLLLCARLFFRSTKRHWWVLTDADRFWIVSCGR